MDETVEYRTYGLLDTLLLIENYGEWLYRIDAETDKIASWYFDDVPCLNHPAATTTS